MYPHVNRSIQTFFGSHGIILKERLKTLQLRIKGMPRKKKESFSQRLLRLRKARGFSQYDLSDATGISQRMIAHYENRIKNPASNVVVRFSKALGVTVEQLMGFKSDKVYQEISRKIMKKAKLLQELAPEDQGTVIRMIDSLAGKNGIKKNR